MDKLTVCATKTGEILAIVKSRNGDNPGFINPACPTLAQPTVKTAIQITDIYNHVDPNCATMFQNFEVTVRRNNRVINVQQPVIVCIPKKLVNNNRSNRKKWATKIAKVITKIMKNMYPTTMGVRFHQDATPMTYADRPVLSEFLTISDVLDVIRKTYPSLKEEEIKNNNNLMEKYYGDKLDAARRYFHMIPDETNDSHPPAHDFLQFSDDEDDMPSL